MNEQRRQILEMPAEGKITADEAERLIDALERQCPEAPSGATARPKARPKYLHVLVNSLDDSGGGGPSRVNVRIPLQLLRAGVRLPGLLPPQVGRTARPRAARAAAPGGPRRPPLRGRHRRRRPRRPGADLLRVTHAQGTAGWISCPDG